MSTPSGHNHSGRRYSLLCGFTGKLQNQYRTWAPRWRCSGDRSRLQHSRGRRGYLDVRNLLGACVFLWCRGEDGCLDNHENSEKYFIHPRSCHSLCTNFMLWNLSPLASCVLNFCFVFKSNTFSQHLWTADTWLKQATIVITLVIKSKDLCCVLCCTMSVLAPWWEDRCARRRRLQRQGNEPEENCRAFHAPYQLKQLFSTLRSVQLPNLDDHPQRPYVMTALHANKIDIWTSDLNNACLSFTIHRPSP